MPHLTLEYSPGALSADDLQTCFADLHVILNETAGIRVEDCKSRAYASEAFRVGDGSDSREFVHLEIRIFGGRSTELKNEISRTALEVLQSHFAGDGGEKRTQITVEVAEIDRESYSKHSTERSPDRVHRHQTR